MTHKELESLTGKLVNIRNLILGGKFNMVYFNQAVHREKVDTFGKVKLSENLKIQASWWLAALHCMDIDNHICHPSMGYPAGVREVWSDAAGGTTTHMGAGLGIISEKGAWTYLPWPTWLNYGGCNSAGVRFSNKLSCLEMLGPLAAMCVMKNEAYSESLVVFVDNQGAVDIHRKGGSTRCIYTSIVAKACFDLSQVMCCNLIVRKIRRCSDADSYIADMISKGNLQAFRKMMPERRRFTQLPRALVDWIKDPSEDLDLGIKIAEEMKITMPDLVV